MCFLLPSWAPGQTSTPLPSPNPTRGGAAPEPPRRPLTELSPFLGAEGFLGKRMSLERYSFSRWTLACRDSVDLFRRLGSTEIPMVRATFLWMPATCPDTEMEPPRPRALPAPTQALGRQMEKGSHVLSSGQCSDSGDRHHRTERARRTGPGGSADSPSAPPS